MAGFSTIFWHRRGARFYREEPSPDDEHWLSRHYLLVVVAGFVTVVAVWGIGQLR